VTWIREEAEQPSERRSLDVVRLVAATLGFLVVGMWAQSQTTIDAQLFEIVNGLGPELENVAKVVYYGLRSIWTVVGVSLALLALGHARLAGGVALAGGGAWGIALLVGEILGTHPVEGVPTHVRVGDGPTYPAVSVAVAAALAMALAPYAVRALRLLAVLVVVEALAAIYLGAGYPSDVLGGMLLAVVIGAGMSVAFGSAAGRPTLSEVREALAGLGFDVVALQYAREKDLRASVVDAELATGQRVRVDATGRDQRDAGVAARVWRRLMYREPGPSVFGTRLEATEHVAYALLLAERADLACPQLVKTGSAGPDVALLVTVRPEGRSLESLTTDAITDRDLAAIWHETKAMHEAGLAHGNLDHRRMLMRPDCTAAFDDYSAADVSGAPYFAKRDDAAVIVSMASLVGNDRAVAAATDCLGKQRIAQVIPLVQPATLPRSLRQGTKHLGQALKALRTELAAAAGVEDVDPLKVRRLDWVDIGMLAGVLVALAIAIPGLQSVDWESVQSEFSNATWGWAVLTLLLWPLIPIAWATALRGCVNAELPFVPTVLTQIACSFLNLITPNGIGGTSLQLDYLYKQDVPVASAGSAMVLSTGVGGAIQMALFLIAAAITATTISTDDTSSDGTGLLAIAIVAALIGIALLVPKVRGKVVPAATRAASDIWAVIRNPRKAMQLFGGDTAGNLIYPFLLGLCLLAFHEHLDFAQLVVVQVGAGMLGNVAPVPGGIGVQEAALTGGLTAFGIPPDAALATVLVFRGITFAIPPIYGFVTLRWLRAQGYA
jgi:uncharacterized membrane protein YbhN (UPF0104 family)